MTLNSVSALEVRHYSVENNCEFIKICNFAALQRKIATHLLE